MDTRPCPNAEILARDVDLLVCEATYLDAEADRAAANGHMTAAQAAHARPPGRRPATGALALLRALRRPRRIPGRGRRRLRRRRGARRLHPRAPATLSHPGCCAPGSESRRITPSRRAWRPTDRSPGAPRPVGLVPSRPDVPGTGRVSAAQLVRCGHGGPVSGAGPDRTQAGDARSERGRWKWTMQRNYVARLERVSPGSGAT